MDPAVEGMGQKPTEKAQDDADVPLQGVGAGEWYQEGIDKAGDGSQSGSYDGGQEWNQAVALTFCFETGDLSFQEVSDKVNKDGERDERVKQCKGAKRIGHWHIVLRV